MDAGSSCSLKRDMRSYLQQDGNDWNPKIILAVAEVVTVMPACDGWCCGCKSKNFAMWILLSENYLIPQCQAKGVVVYWLLTRGAWNQEMM